MENSNKKGFRFQEKGYYIALVLCAVAIGISGVMYYQNVSVWDDTQSSGDALSAGGTGAVTTPAIATEPTPSVWEKPTEPTKPTVKPTEPAKVWKTASPLTGSTVLGYAMECLAYNPTTRDWRVHDGIDIAAEAGTPVTAAADGTVYTTFVSDTMGTTVVIRHENGYVTTYASLAENIKVTPGQTVKLGQTIGYVGNTALLETALGDHIHFAVTQNNVSADPVRFLEGA